MRSSTAVVPAITAQARQPAATLYISYDGILEPLGESQVLGYVERLAVDYAITLITFEKPHDLRDRARVSAFRSRLRVRGITWVCLRYHKRPPVLSTAFDIVAAIRAARHAMPGGAALIHARGYVPGVVALALARRWRTAFVFDMRGFWPDEKVDGGHWSRHSPVYALAKYFERRFFESAQAIVSLTREGVEAFASLGYRIPRTTCVEVIPTCTDLERFTPGPPDQRLAAELGLDGCRVIGVSGTISNWYLRHEMLRAIAFLMQALPDTKVLIVTREDAARLRTDAAAAGIPGQRLVLTAVDYARMPAYVRLMDVGLFFIKPCFSKKGSCATKLAEFLATGVPVVINEGVGDSGALVREHRGGIVLPEPTVTALQQQLPNLIALLADRTTPGRCRAAAREHFDVDDGSRKYARVYDRVLSSVASLPTHEALGS
jgi:glycosyltransferase involved in cell wall biosynthesis